MNEQFRLMPKGEKPKMKDPKKSPIVFTVLSLLFGILFLLPATGHTFDISAVLTSRSVSNGQALSGQNMAFTAAFSCPLPACPAESVQLLQVDANTGQVVTQTASQTLPASNGTATSLFFKTQSGPGKFTFSLAYSPKLSDANDRNHNPQLVIGIVPGVQLRLTQSSCGTIAANAALPTGISCGTNCARFLPNTAVRVNSQTSQPHNLLHWQGQGSASTCNSINDGSACQFTITQDSAILGVFGTSEGFICP